MSDTACEVEPADPPTVTPPAPAPAPLPLLTPPRERLVTASLARLLMAVLGSGLSMYLLTSVVPLYLASTGSGGVGAGLATGAMMLSAVAMELAVPALLVRFGYRNTLALGLVLLGLPALVLLTTTALPLVLAVCAVRGAGLGIMVVGGVALVAELVPAHRRGEGLGVYGMVVGLPAIIGLPLGVYLTGPIGFNGVFVIAAAVSLAGLVFLPGLPGRRSAQDLSLEKPHLQVLGGLRGSGLLMPTFVFAAVTVAAGITVTFLPLAVAEDKHTLVAAALLVQAVAAPVARWLAGRYGDRHGATRLLAPALLSATLGAASLILIDSPVTVLVGMLLFGAGFGAAQNVTLAMMYDRVPPSRYGQVSALWNLAYDAGWGVGAIAFGAAVGVIGYPTAFGLTAALLAVALVPAVRASAT